MKFMLVCAAALLVACGAPPSNKTTSQPLVGANDNKTDDATKVSDPTGDSEISTDHASNASVEDVIDRFTNTEKIPAQQVNEEELKEREASLIPLEQFDQDAAPITVEDRRDLQTRFALDENDRDIVDLRAHDTGIRNQGSEGLCTAFATIASVENLGRRLYTQQLDLSERHHWRSYRIYQTPPSLSAAERTGLIDESLWPYKGSPQAGYASKVRAKLTAVQPLQGSISEIVDSVRSGYPVVLNLIVDRSFMQPREGGIISGGGMRLGGHAIAVTGVVLDQRVPGGGYLVIKNSWGNSWGESGYGYVAFDYCKRSYCYAWSVKDFNLYDDAGSLVAKASEGENNNEDSADNGEPTPPPTPPDQPVPTPTEESISAQDFKMQLVLRGRGLFGAANFVLGIDAPQGALSQIASITYQLSNGVSYRVLNSAPTGIDVKKANLVSRNYKARQRGWETLPAIIKLKDGREFEIPGIVINW